MKKRIWLWNHYAADMYKNRGGRHYWLAKHLTDEGYDVAVFCASTIHNSNENFVEDNRKFITANADGIPFVIIRTPGYAGNGVSRLLNMLAFYRNLFAVSKEYAQINGKPDVILASSVHPMTPAAGIKAARKFGVPCICEIRDLWPESLAAYGIVKNKALLSLMYAGEKWIYERADKLVFLMEGGRDYITEKGWDKAHGGKISLDKVYHINNGVDLEMFEHNRKNHIFVDGDLENDQIFKVVYTGSIRLVNNVKKIVDVAAALQKTGRAPNVKFLIYGGGDEKESLEKYCAINGIGNVVFKGVVERKYIPYILSRSDLNIIHFRQNSLKKYGASQNKLFEYFASGKPVVSDCEFGYDLIKRYNCGIVADGADENQMAEVIARFAAIPEDEYLGYCRNAAKAARDYDFGKLTKKLIEIINL